MSFLAEFTLPSTEFPLGGVLETYPDVTIEFESVVPTHHGLLPFVFVWGDGDGFEGVRAELADDEAIDAVEEVERFEDGRLYHLDWSDGTCDVATAIRESGATLIDAIGTDSSWRFEIRFRDQERIETFQSFVREREIDLELERLRTELEIADAARFDLTEKQYETLVRAFEAGWFENPKEATLEELSDELGVSSAAVTGRLRRGLTALLSQTVMRGEDG